MIPLGASYYPEQTPRGRWPADFALMRDAGFKVVRMGEFAWAFLEPEIGKFEFAWLEEAVTLAAEAGLQVVLGTPTAAPPAWLTSRLAGEVLPVGADGQIRRPGSRRHYCSTSPAYLHHASRIAGTLAERFGRHPSVVGWQIDNELGCHETVRCYCERCATLFQVFLEKRYGSLDALNQAWGAAVWSQQYSAWEEILPPSGLVYRANPGHWLDWCRFSSQNWELYLELQARVVRERVASQWVAHNFMGRFDELDHAALVRHLDMVGYDHYAPAGSGPEAVAFELDRMRGLKQRPFWVFEQQAANIDWGEANPALRPGQARLLTLQAIAHGADAVLYWPWRAPLSGAEQLHGAVLPHSGVPGRVFRELQALAAELRELPDLGFAKSPIALLRGDASRWALRLQPLGAHLADPDLYDFPFYRALWTMGLDADVIPPDADLTGYRVVVAATQALVDRVLADRLAQYAAAGGLLVLSVRTGLKDDAGHVWPEGAPGPLAGLCGVRVVEFDAPPPEDGQAIGFEDGAWFEAGPWRERLERLEPQEGTWVVAKYLQGYLADEPAIVSRLHGEGRVWYCGTLGRGPDLAEHLLRTVVAEAGLVPAVVPGNVEIRTRPSTRGALRFVLNHSAEFKAIGLEEDAVDLLTGAACSGILELSPYGAAVLARA